MEKLEERIEDFEKITDHYFDILSDISGDYFESNIENSDLEEALIVAENIRTSSYGVTIREFENFKKKISKLKSRAFREYSKFLSNLKSGQFDMDGVAIDYGYENYADYENAIDYGEEDPIDEIEEKSFRFFSNDKEGNSSVVNSVMDSYKQAISYYGDLEDFYENKI